MSRTIIIAEAGVNHNGSIELAKKLVDAASEAGVDYVKFQTFNAKKLASKNSKKADYQNKNTSEGGDSQQDMLSKLELSKESHYELIEYCKEKKVKFFSTAFDLDSIDFLNQLNLDIWKIPSGEITNYPYLKRIATTRKPIILSTGMCDMLDIRNALNVFISNGVSKNNITILHCNTEYPTPYGDVNLNAMNTIGREFDVKIGYSDHTLGIEVPIAAVALGAKIIEKHFTLDRTMEGPDHKASVEPSELKQMVNSIRNIEEALGSSEKVASASELKNIAVARKSIVALAKIKKGEVFTEDNLAVKRPGNGISPMKWEEIIGRKAIKDFEEDDLIEI
ncbi:N-acetylneuraminate synthase [Dysgonomonas macrotermitis]|uniref:N-acetylneuraminate synthase n=1 Tax=Dysgonomonas macrotermitis TaxID=1346286 RepID=A0A1M5I3L5_9BACT|nr:N-acetylneuraminate synthase [Dysgonomonas macrotermitis]SHG22811.1 N-acetylneuraminate synthase [Dysgonomonas macrotermitis]